MPGRTIAVPGDVADPDHRRALVDAARELGRPRPAREQRERARPVADAAARQPRSRRPRGDPAHEHSSRRSRSSSSRFRCSRRTAAAILNITSDAAVEGYEGWGGYGASKAALEQLSNVLAAEQPDLRVYWVDPGDMRTQMHQDAFPGEDISDRPPPEESVPGLLALIEGDHPSGRYQARALAGAGVAG